MRKQLTKLISTITAGICLLGAATCNFSERSSLKANAADYEKKGESGDYTYEVWNQNNEGEFTFENTENNGFSASWDSISNLDINKGLSYPRDSVNAYQLNEYQIVYDLDITTDGNAYVGVSGYFTKPTVQFYIIEAWGSWQPPGDNFADAKIATATIDGTTYSLYRHLKLVQFEDITYPVYWSVAERDPIEADKPTHLEGTIDILSHFKAWADVGLDLGNLYEIMFNLDAYKSNGSFRLNSLDIRASVESELVDDKFQSAMPYQKHDPLPMDKTGKFISVDFESGADKFDGLGEGSTAAVTDDRSFSGERSLNVTGADDTAAAVFYELDPYDMPVTDSEPHYYQVGARIFQDSGHDVFFNVDLIEYSIGASLYKTVTNLGTVMCGSGQWKKSGGILFSFKHNPYHKYRIVFTPAEPVDYCLDDFYIASGEAEYIFNIKNFDPDIRGDLNGDGVINSLDIAACRRAIMNSMGVRKIETSGDVNGDYMSNVSDLVILTKYVLGTSSEIPASGNEEVLYLGDNSITDEASCRSFEVKGQNIIRERLLTVLRKDYSFTSEWQHTDEYSCKNCLNLSESFDKKYCRDSVISYSADMKCSGDIDVSFYGYLKDGYRELFFTVYECWENEYTRRFHDEYKEEDSLQVITINGIEYDMHLYEVSSTSAHVTLFRRNSPVNGEEAFHIENEIALGDLMKFLPESLQSRDMISYIGSEIKSENSYGYADFKKLSFIKE